MLNSEFIGAGETATFNILKMLTKLNYKSLKEFPNIGIYKQVPISWLLPRKEYKFLSEPHRKGSIDILLISKSGKIAVRVQGKGHGMGMKGAGKSKHDAVQRNMLSPYCQVVDIKLIECPEIFKERTTNKATEEIISSFKTEGVLIPVC